MTDGLTMTDNDRLTMTDARHVQHEANADDLAAVQRQNTPTNGCSGKFFFNIFYDLTINSNIILISCCVDAACAAHVFDASRQVWIERGTSLFSSLAFPHHSSPLQI